MNINKKVFIFYSTGLEDYTSEMLYHPRKSQAQFKKDCIFIARKYFPTYLKLKGYFIMDEFIPYCAKKMKELGYTVIKPRIYGVFGHSYLLKGDQRNNEYIELLGEDFLNQAIEINEHE